MKKNRGITLIALIITIIVMLILVAVSISIALNTGLFKSASDATKNWKTAQEEESKMQIEIGGKKYDSIDDYLEGKEAIQEIHNWVRTGDTLTCGHCNKTYTIGDVVDYTDKGSRSTSISAEKAGGYTGTETVGNIGVKVASLKLNNNLKIATSGGGASGQPTATQTLQKDENITWIVLGAESSNGDDGTNETLLITTKEPTTEGIVLYGAAGYNNCIDEIDRMCKELYGADARGMTIEDVNECVNYKKLKGMYYINDKWNETQNLTTKLKDLGEDYGNMWTAITDYNTNNRAGVFYDPSNPEGIKDSGAVLGEYNLDGYFYHLSDDGTYLVNEANTSDTSHTITTAEKNVIFGESEDYRYWLASRGVCANSHYAAFGPGAVRGGGADSFGVDFLFNSYGGSDGGELPLRCVVSLRSDIPAVVE